MANAGDMNNKLTELAQLEEALRKAFDSLGTEYSPRLGLIGACRLTQRLQKEGLLSRWYNYPLAMALSVAFGFATIFTANYLYILPYTAAVVWVAKSWKKYVAAFAVHKLGTQNFINFGFGLSNLSLATVGIIKLLDAGGSRLTKDAISSIIKIVKASQDHGEISFGFAEALKKSLYLAPFPALVSAFENADKIRLYTDASVDAVVRNPLVLAFFVTIALPLLVVLYDVMLGQTLAKQRKKKYLLLLTIIVESFVK